MKHPLTEIEANYRLHVFLLFLAFTLAVMLALNLSGRSLITDAAPAGIVSYEFAGDVATAEAIIESWDDDARISAGFNIGLDYLYLVLYSTTIAMAILWLTDGLTGSMWLILLGTALAWAQWLAAALDAVENLALLTMLVNQPADPWPQLAWACAAVKFSIVGAGLIYVTVALLGRVVRRLSTAD